jgi:putative transposase
MKPERHCRRSIRLKGYNYSQAGAYFITICTQGRECLFGQVVDGTMRLNDAGQMIQAIWQEIPNYYSGVAVDAFVVMPNHIHGIIILVGAVPHPNDDQPVGTGPRACPDKSPYAYPNDGQPVGAGPRACPDIRQPHGMGQPQGVAPTLSLPNVVHRFKTITTKRYIDGVKQCGWHRFQIRLWQRNYFEHIIRDDESLHHIRQYIVENPLRWHLDRENPNAIGTDEQWNALFVRITSQSPLCDNADREAKT